MTTDNYPCQNQADDAACQQSRDDQEAAYYFVLNDFINLVKTYGPEQVVHDLYLADHVVFEALDEVFMG